MEKWQSSAQGPCTAGLPVHVETDSMCIAKIYRKMQRGQKESKDRRELCGGEIILNYNVMNT